MGGHQRIGSRYLEMQDLEKDGGYQRAKKYRRNWLTGEDGDCSTSSVVDLAFVNVLVVKIMIPRTNLFGNISLCLLFM